MSGMAGESDPERNPHAPASLGFFALGDPAALLTSLVKADSLFSIDFMSEARRRVFASRPGRLAPKEGYAGSDADHPMVME